jgi:pimeloyl-ACP methyl ester carboxylesterase
VHLAGCAPDVLVWAAPQVRPHAMVSLVQVPSEVAWRARPTTYVVATADTVIDPAAQRTWAAARTHDVHEVTAGHMLPIQDPAALAKILAGCAR